MYADEVTGVRQAREPLDQLEKWLLEYDFCTKEEIKVIKRQKQSEVNAALEFAKAAPEPPARELVSDIYSGMKVTPRMVNMP